MPFALSGQPRRTIEAATTKPPASARLPATNSIPCAIKHLTPEYSALTR